MMKIQKKEIGRRIRKDFQNFWMAGLAIALYTILVNVTFHAFCPMVILTGFPCPGCGITRSLFYLVTGRVVESIAMQPLGIVIAGIFLYFVWNRYIIGRNPKELKFIIGAALLLLIAFYIGRMYLYFPQRVPYVYTEGNILERTLPYYKQILHHLGVL